MPCPHRSGGESAGAGPEAAAAAAAGLCVLNTHLFYHPRAPHIRTMHIAALMAAADALLRDLPASAVPSAAPSDGKSDGAAAGIRPSVVFCGDLNSDLNEGIPGAAPPLAHLPEQPSTGACCSRAVQPPACPCAASEQSADVPGSHCGESQQSAGFPGLISLSASGTLRWLLLFQWRNLHCGVAAARLEPWQLSGSAEAAARPSLPQTSSYAESLLACRVRGKATCTSCEVKT